jgi:hypothetical protein
MADERTQRSEPHGNSIQPNSLRLCEASARLAGLEFVNHPPNTIGFPTLDDL